MNNHVEIVSFARATNEALILAVLSRGDMYGYQIALTVEEASRNTIVFNHGTLYPILHSLEKKGYIQGSWEEGGSARNRKYYSLTPKGKKYFDNQRDGLRDLFDGVMQVLGGGENESF